MTLLIGTYSDTHIVLTADGLCVEGDPGCHPKYKHNLQKIFPVSNLPIAILHHGENKIGGRYIKEIIDDFICKHLDLINKSSMDKISEVFLNFLDVKAKERLEEVAWTGGGIGFWVTGFSPNKIEPEIHEVWWERLKKATITPLDRLVAGGEGKEFIRKHIIPEYKPIGQYKFETIKTAEVDYLIGYHNELYKLAEEEQKKQPDIIFGGHKHQLVIAKSQQWILPPL